MRKYLPVLTAIVVLQPLSALAWQSEVHTGTVQLTRTIYGIPGLSTSDRRLVSFAEAEAKCYGAGSKPSYRSTLDAMQRIYLNLVCGSDEPDRARNPFKNDDGFFAGVGELIRNHKSNPGPLAVREFKTAMTTFQQRGNKAYAEAAAHLGRSLHLLGDTLDFTVNMPSVEHKDLRKHAKALTERYLGQWQGRAYPDRLNLELNDIRFAPGHSPQTPEALIAVAAKVQKDETGFLKQIIDEARGEERTRRTHVIGTREFYRLIFLQEQWVLLYLRAIGVP